MNRMKETRGEMKKTIKITKGKDAFLDITPLADYCRQRGFRVIQEVVTIQMPEGRELEDLSEHLKTGRLRVVKP